MKQSSPFLILLLVSPACLSFYSDETGIVELDPSNFDDTVPGSGIWLVEFYAPWCDALAWLTNNIFAGD